MTKQLVFRQSHNGINLEVLWLDDNCLLCDCEKERHDQINNGASLQFRQKADIQSSCDEGR